MPLLTPETLGLLRAPDGAALLAAAAALGDDPFAAEKLRRQGTWPPGLAAAAVEQVRLRRRAAAKFSRAGEMWFALSLLEQASGEEISRCRAQRFAGYETVGDLCCGLGGDTVPLAEQAPVLAFDRDGLARALTGANVEAWKPRFSVDVRAGSVPEDVPRLPAAWVDPGRREGRSRTRSVERMSPPLDEVLSLRERIPDLGVKLSPASPDAELDSFLARIPHEREYVSLRGVCRELDLWLGGLTRAASVGRGGRRATVLPAGATLAGAPGPYGEVRAPGAWLLEPDAAVIRAGLVGNLARELGAWPVDPRLAFLSADRELRSPFGVTYRIEEPEPFSGKALAEKLRRRLAGDVVLKTRGAAVEPDRLRQQLRGVLKQGKPGCCPVVFITRFGDRAVMILGERIGAGATD